MGFCFGPDGGGEIAGKWGEGQGERVHETFLGLNAKNSVYSRVSVTGYLSHFVSVTYHLNKCRTVSAEIEARADVVIGLCRAKAATG